MDDSVIVKEKEPETEVPRYGIGIRKTADAEEYEAVGDVINYTIEVRNTGNTSLTGVTVIDELLDNELYVSGDINGNEKLDVGEIWIYKGSYIVTEADIENGSIINTATADSNETEPVDDSVTVNGKEPETEVPEYGIGIRKTADVKVYEAVGDVVNYTIEVRNTGNTPLTGVKVSDELLDNEEFVSGDTNENGKLDVGEIWIYKGSYIVTEADVEEGSITNIATADSNETEPKDDTVVVTLKEEKPEEPEEPENPGNPNNPNVPDDDDDDPNVPISDPTVPLGGETVQDTSQDVPQNTDAEIEAIEEQPVPLAAMLPDTGEFLNTRLLAIFGTLLLAAGIALNRKRRIN